jgi:hypothetical protein
LVWWAWAAPALALTVALVGPPAHSPQTNEALSRLRGELLSLGFEVTVSERPGALERSPIAAREWLARMAAERGVDAALDVTASGVDVWIIGAAPSQYNVTRVLLEADAENAPERLAIRAIELLRSGLLETGLAARRAAHAPTPARETPSPAPERRDVDRARVGLELGAAALASLDGVGPAVLPMLRVDWETRPWLMRATFAGFGTRPTLTSPSGRAQLAQQYGLVGASYRLGAIGSFTPNVGLAMGFLRTAVEGHAAPPKQGHALEKWSLLLDGSLGTAFDLTRRYYLTLAMHVQVAEPYVAVRFVDETVASSGRPNVLLTCSLGGWL